MSNSLNKIDWIEFLYVMTSREVKARYKHALLGFLWIVINPLLQMIIMGFIFRYFIPVDVDNYFLFLFTGLLPWMYFSLSLTKATPAIVNERALIQKSRFPREIIVLAIVFSNLFHFLSALSLLLLVLVAQSFLQDGYVLQELFSIVLGFFKLLPVIVWLTLLISGITLLTSSLNVRFRDINFVVQAVVPLWFYATPIVYSLELLPKRLYPIFYLNPLTAIIEQFQLILLSKSPAEPELKIISLLVTAIFFYCGVFFFQSQKRWFDDWF